MKKFFVLLLFALAITIIFVGCDSSLLFPTSNNAPVITSTPIITSASVGINYTYQVTATDEDGDTLIFSVSTVPATDMYIGSSTGLISWTPTEEGSYNVTVKVSDGKSTDTQTFNINVSTETTTSKRVVMMELFEGPACSRCAAVHSDIVRLRGEYGFDELVILEEFSSDYGETGWWIYEAWKRHSDYLKYLGINGELPDAYFNGLSRTVHCSDGEGYVNYNKAIEEELAKPSQIAISASYEIIGTTATITGSITNTSDNILNDLVVEAMVCEDSVYLGFRKTNVDHVVRQFCPRRKP